MHKMNIVRSASMFRLLFVCFFPLIANSFAADDARKAAAGTAGEKANVRLEVLSPHADIIAPSEISGLIAPRVTDLSGKNIGVIWCGKDGGQHFLDVIAELLKQKYPSATISRFTWDVDNAKEKVLRDVDAFIYGVGDTGLGGWESTARAVVLEKLGKPGVVIFCEHLMQIAKAAAYAQGMPAVRMVTLPDLEYYPNRSNVKDVRPCAIAAFAGIVDALTRPMQPSEGKADLKPQKTAAASSAVITADTAESAYEKFYQLFMDNNWGDGLPLVPPTRDNVQRMLQGTKLPPDMKIGVMPTPDGLANMANVTVEKVAINAVMAGAKPEYLPIIIAAMEGVTDKNFSPHVFTSDGSFNLLIAVSGPIAKKIGMHSGIGLLGHGWRANNTIGRAVRLCLNNICHLKPGEFDTALVGRPSSHTFYVMAENEESNPWGPYHTVRGYRAEDSYVTVSGIGSYLRMYAGGSAWKAEEVLDRIVKEIAASRVMFGSYRPGEGSGFASRPLNRVFVLNPGMVLALQKLGLTSRQSLRDYLIEKTSIPYEQLSEQEILGIKKRLSEKSEAFFGSDNIPDDRIPVIREALRPGGKVPVVISPDDINIFVSGGVSEYTFGASYLRGAHMVKLVR